MISAKVGGKTCFFVSSPWSASRQNLTVQSSFRASAPSTWSAPTVVDPAASSYSSLVYTPSGKLLDLFSAPPTTHAALPLPLTSPPFGGSQCVAEARTRRGSASRRCRSLGWREGGTRPKCNVSLQRSSPNMTSTHVFRSSTSYSSSF